MAGTTRIALTSRVVFDPRPHEWVPDERQHAARDKINWLIKLHRSWSPTRPALVAWRARRDEVSVRIASRLADRPSSTWDKVVYLRIPLL